MNRGEGPQEAVAGHGACSPLPSLLGGPEGPWRPTRKLPWPDTGREAPVLEFRGGNQQAPPHPAASPLGRGGLPGVDPVPGAPLHVQDACLGQTGKRAPFLMAFSFTPSL